ncbi:MAG TPA: hypothetical protein VNI54_12730 [Thermoanaerobaculia bacterium]|nr:hypothetical protein [Thermoanaerobaculia bacterium]
MTKRKMAVVAGATLLALFVSNALAGGPASEQALRAFDQNLMDAWGAKVGADPRIFPRVDGFLVERRVPVALFTYYYGQVLVAGRESSCASRHSVVVWYGFGASLVWQDGLWFPDRTSTHQRFAETGMLDPS